MPVSKVQLAELESVPPTPPLAKLAETMSVFPSDHYPNPMLGRLANDQSMVIDDIMDGSFPPKRLVSRHQPSDSFLSFSTQSPSPIAVSDPSPNTPSTIKAQHVHSSGEDRHRPRLRLRSRNSQQSTTRDLTKPKRPPRDHRRPPPPPGLFENSIPGSSFGSQPKKFTSSDIIMRSPRNHRDSVDLIRARVSDGERKAKIPRLSRDAQAISLHDELFPTCLPSFPARPTARLLPGGSSSQGAQNHDGPLAEERPNALVMSHNNSSRLSITLRDLRHPIQLIFRSQSRHSDSQQDQENVAPTPGKHPHLRLYTPDISCRRSIKRRPLRQDPLHSSVITSCPTGYRVLVPQTQNSANGVQARLRTS